MARFVGPVGGIVYKPTIVQDIYGEDINLPHLSSYVHDPIQVTQSTSEYQPRFKNKFSTPTSNDDPEIISSNITPEAKLVVINPTLNSDVVDTVSSERVTPVIQSEVSIKSDEAQKENESQVKTKTSYASNEDAWNNAWTQYGSSLGLKDQRAYAYLLGQIKHESGNFKYMEGLNSGEEYEGRSDLGNVQRGDGARFKERGPLQVTGRANYEKIYKDFFIPNGLGQYDIVNNPELAKDPYIGSLLSIGWLATTNNGRRAIASANNYDIRGTTYAINGGYNGLEDRIKRTNKLLNDLA